jgi:hypothetical protein
MDGVERTRSHVLFGYDGTAGDDAALRWAAGEARLRGLDLVMCHCWHWPYPDEHEDAGAEVIMKRAGENLLENGVRRARELGVPGTVRKRLRRGPAAEALVRASGGAELVVVGVRGRLDAGSTAPALAARAERPVVAVRDRAGPRRVVAGIDASASSAAVRSSASSSTGTGSSV